MLGSRLTLTTGSLNEGHTVMVAKASSEDSGVRLCEERMGFRVEIEFNSGGHKETKLGYVTGCDRARRIVYIDEEAILEDDICRVRAPGPL